MIDAVIRDGYCIAQEYLPAAAEGDVRLFVMNGRPLEKDGKVAAFRRVNKTGDARSNMHSGGKSEPVEVTDEMRQIVDIVGPKLVRDGMFLVGLDIVGDKLMEINVFSPGGLGSASEFTGVDFADLVIEDLERKVEERGDAGAGADERRSGDHSSATGEPPRRRSAPLRSSAARSRADRPFPPGCRAAAGRRSAATRD